MISPWRMLIFRLEWQWFLKLDEILHAASTRLQSFRTRQQMNLLEKTLVENKGSFWTERISSIECIFLVTQTNRVPSSVTTTHIDIMLPAAAWSFFPSLRRAACSRTAFFLVSWKSRAICRRYSWTENVTCDVKLPVCEVASVWRDVQLPVCAGNDMTNTKILEELQRCDQGSCHKRHWRVVVGVDDLLFSPQLLKYE